MANDDRNYVKNAIASNKICPPDILRSLSKEDDIEIRKSVAIHQNCPEDALKRLYRDYQAVRLLVVLNPKCPNDILYKAVGDQDDMIRSAAQFTLNRNFE